MQLATGQHRLEQVPRIHRTFGFPCPNDRVQLIDKRNDLAVRAGDLFEHGFETLFEFAAIFRAGDQRAHVEGDDLLIFKAFRDVAADDPLREPFDDRRLAHTRLADEDRIVFRPAREHLNDPTDLIVASDNRVEFPLAPPLS